MSIQVTKRPYSNVFSGNPVFYQLYSEAAVNDLSIYFEIQVQFRYTDGSFAPVLVTPLPYYPVLGFADIDIKDILHAHLQYGLIPFFSDEKTTYPSEMQTGWFYIEFREITTANASPSWNTSESSHSCFVLKGGLNFWKYRGNNWWVNYYPVQKPFLTWQTSGRLAAPDERMYLAFLQTYFLTTLTMRIRVQYTDGSAAFPSVSIASNRYAVHYLPVGAAQLDLGSIHPEKTIYYWEVWMEASPPGDVISEVFRYYIDNRHDDNHTTLHYRNSLGGLDSVRIRGVIEENTSYNYNEQESATSPDYFSGSTVQPQRRIGDNTEQITYKGDIGHLGREEQDRLRDAFLQREVYWEVDKKWWPVIITTKNNKLRSTDSQRWTMPIEWELAYNGGDYYTPKAIDLGDGVFNDNVCMAKVTPLTVTVDLSGSDAAVTFEGIIVDPQAASTQFQYRLERVAGTVDIDWTTALYSTFPITVSLPKDNDYYLRTRSVCTGDVLGAINSKWFSTTPVSGGGGGGGGTPPELNSYLFNDGTDTSFDLSINGAVVLSGFAGTGNQVDFNLPDTPAATVRLVLGYSPAFATMVVASVNYPGTITGNNVVFPEVDIVGGIQILIN